jgi:hypothetical protein
LVGPYEAEADAEGETDGATDEDGDPEGTASDGDVNCEGTLRLGTTVGCAVG